VAIGHDEQRRRQAAALEIGQQAAPGRRPFGRRQLQRQQLLLSGLRHTEGGQDGHADHAPGETHAQVHAIEEHDRIALVGQRPLLPGREVIFDTGDHARHGALREVRLAQQRLQGRANAPAVDATEVAAQQGLIHLAGAPRIARHHGALKLLDVAIGGAQPRPRDRDRPRPFAGRQRPLGRAVPIAPPQRRPDMVIGAQRSE
jgi:hypothetical protein